MPKNVQTTTQLHPAHTLAVILESLQARLQKYMNCKLPDVQAEFRKGRGTRDQIANIHCIIKKAGEFQKKKNLVLLYWLYQSLWLCSFQFNCSVMSNALQPHGPQHTRPPCPSPTPRVYSKSCPLSRWCHPTISFSVVCFSSCLQSFPASGSFQKSQLFISGGQSFGVSASAPVLPVNTQD